MPKSALKNEPIYFMDAPTTTILKDAVACIPKRTKVYVLGGRMRNALYYRYFGKMLPCRDFDLYVSGDVRRFISNLRGIGFVYGRMRRKDEIVVKKRKFTGASRDEDSVVFDIHFFPQEPTLSVEEDLKRKTNFTINGFALPLDRMFSKDWHRSVIALKTSHEDLMNKRIRVNAYDHPAQLYACIRFVSMGFEPPPESEVKGLVALLKRLRRNQFERNMKKVFRGTGGKEKARQISRRLGITTDIFSYAAIKKHSAPHRHSVHKGSGNHIPSEKRKMRNHYKSSIKFPNMSALRIKGNRIIDGSGSEVTLKGTSINEPYTLLVKEHHDFLKDLENVKRFGFNTVRVPISPAYWQSRKDYSRRVLDPIVSFTRKNSLYCILDWHAQGNPKSGETRSADLVVEGFMKYDSGNNLAESALLELAERYGKEKHILFELFSMPNLPWKDWRDVAVAWISKMRKRCDSVLIVNAVNWGEDLSIPLHKPIRRKNILYGVMIYPNFRSFSSVINAKREHPVIIDECGYTDSSTDPKVFRGTRKGYAIPLKRLISENKLSWVAWVYHPFGYTSKASVLINSWNPNDLSAWGTFVKKELL